MDSSVSAKDKIWFLRVCHHVSNALYDLRSTVRMLTSVVHFLTRPCIRQEQRCSVMWPQSCRTAAARSCVYNQWTTRKLAPNNETLQEAPNNDRDTPIATNTTPRSYKSCGVFLRIVFKFWSQLCCWGHREKAIRSHCMEVTPFRNAHLHTDHRRFIPRVRTLYLRYYVWWKTWYFSFLTFWAKDLTF